MSLFEVLYCKVMHLVIMIETVQLKQDKIHIKKIVCYYRKISACYFFFYQGVGIAVMGKEFKRTASKV